MVLINNLELVLGVKTKLPAERTLCCYQWKEEKLVKTYQKRVREGLNGIQGAQVQYPAFFERVSWFFRFLSVKH